MNDPITICVGRARYARNDSQQQSSKYTINKAVINCFERELRFIIDVKDYSKSQTKVSFVSPCD